MRVNNYNDLKEWKKVCPRKADYKINVLVCNGTSCLSSDSEMLAKILEKEMLNRDLNGEIRIVKTGCFGFCGQGPIIKIEPDDVTYVQVKVEDIAEIVESHLVNRIVVSRLLYKEPNQTNVVEQSSGMNFYKKQMRIALRNCGEIDPENIEDYIVNNGYFALAKVLQEYTPDEVIKIVKESGLRGRGGGGFNTGLKWELTRKVPGREKYIVCNADEGDPGAFMDRSILEGDPHSVLEAMMIAGYAIGASQGLIYIRAEYGVATNRLYRAIKDAKEAGLIGKNIFGTDFSFDINIKLGAGAFVCGEETALIRSMEGFRGEPNKKPPFPSVQGFRGKPTSVNNVETFANVPAIILNGSKWFSSIGTEKSKGTKVFALAGQIRNNGLVEVPMGTTFREIIYDIGGGHPQGKEIKAIQIGGPSGGVITKDFFDTKIDYESLLGMGAMMGSGGMIIMDEDNDMVKIAKFYLEFTQDESCGKCTPCRIGTKRMYEILENLVNMKGKPEDLDRLRILGENIKNTSLCGLGQTAPNPVLSTMKYFMEEYEAYAYRTKRTTYSIDPKLCIGCTKCARNCPVSCIEGKVKEPHYIDETKCIACGACYEACPVHAIIKP
ncbi:MAG: NADH-quinone oxidoreductase subunit J/K [Tenericutes bacterium HGW-Tenericutes-5]|jgi:NADH:ubiquinone oxidoreductase subunit F (NADH-binding)/(2Fe-2S) ferredoxin|nr:MAG: NADH-quinone oxidoreductase subunit J/K [Tenericutes bacterium HGW-Tenericutes-5]PKK95693.1 MAG: NADH-quinone oxidoreductase subunit J/K [Tenericutes bacterium HGW-Tenericutes-4]